ncbi:MAG: ATP-dependent DNA ligase [Candidatus Eremiobacteraeota bacterium]|nr:ATP-dependent DNA ligase [Candidatus Eremiobacteraeota bacterium]
MIAFARTCDDIAATPAKTLKVERLADYIRSLGAEDLRAVVRFLAGRPLGAHDERKLAIGGRILTTAARRLWHPSDEELSAAYRATGDLGDALARIVRAPQMSSLFAETLTPADFATILDELAAAPGKAAGRRRELVCERVFRACRDPREVAYVAKILLGELRIGLREGLIVDAVALAFGEDSSAVRRAAMAAGDLGAVALAAAEKRLESLAITYGKPLGFMLATPVAFGSSYREIAGGEWLVEDKYDGIRAQAHVRAGRARLFSRTMRDISRAFPELIDALARNSDVILDGEIVARRDGVVLPFRYLQARLGRIDPPLELRTDVPVAFVAFDLLAVGDRFVLDEPLGSRRRLLAEHVSNTPALEIAPWAALEAEAAPGAIATLFAAARARGNEGLMLKRTDSPYAPGRRGKWWLKLKRELGTLDCVVIAVEWGHGKRRNVLSDYTFAVRRSADDAELLPIGKAYSGLTDVEIAELTPWFLAHRTGTPGSHALPVEPTILVEIAFDIIQKSKLHRSGFALRFPRIVRLRHDKTAADINTLADVEHLYREMLEREGVHI